MSGSNPVAHLTATWNEEQMRMNIARLQHTKPFMPPFAGTPEDLEALVQYVRWSHDGEPPDWRISDDADVLAQIARWIREAGSDAASSHNAKGPG